jgi:hypothetical protein
MAEAGDAVRCALHEERLKHIYESLADIQKAQETNRQEGQKAGEKLEEKIFTRLDEIDGQITRLWNNGLKSLSEVVQGHHVRLAVLDERDMNHLREFDQYRQSHENDMQSMIGNNALSRLIDKTPKWGIGAVCAGLGVALVKWGVPFLEALAGVFGGS